MVRKYARAITQKQVPSDKTLKIPKRFRDFLFLILKEKSEEKRKNIRNHYKMQTQNPDS